MVAAVKLRQSHRVFFPFLSGVWVPSRTETTTEEDNVSVGREAVCCECALITILNGGRCIKH